MILNFASRTLRRTMSVVAASASPPKSRVYPKEPLVGVGVLVFRESPDPAFPEVLIAQRAKEPAKGKWSFPGGSLELGETMAECAAREIEEETGLRLRDDNSSSASTASAASSSWGIGKPQSFAAWDSIYKDDQGAIQYHYVVVNVAATAADPAQIPTPSSDVSAVRFVRGPELEEMCASGEATSNCYKAFLLALGRFGSELGYQEPKQP